MPPPPYSFSFSFKIFFPFFYRNRQPFALHVWTAGMYLLPQQVRNDLWGGMGGIPYGHTGTRNLPTRNMDMEQFPAFGGLFSFNIFIFFQGREEDLRVCSEHRYFSLLYESVHCTKKTRHRWYRAGSINLQRKDSPWPGPVYCYTTAYSNGVSRDLERCSHRMQPRVGTVFAQQQSTIRIDIQYSSLTLALPKCGGGCLLLYICPQCGGNQYSAWVIFTQWTNRKAGYRVRLTCLTCHLSHSQGRGVSQATEEVPNPPQLFTSPGARGAGRSWPDHVPRQEWGNCYSLLRMELSVEPCRTISLISVIRHRARDPNQ